MTRKKFIKQLMCMGIQRNDARELAAVAIADGMTYQDAYALALGYNIGVLFKKAIKSTDPTAVFISSMSVCAPFIPAAVCRSIVEACSEKPYIFDKPALPSLYKLDRHDGLRTDFAFADEWATAPGALQSAEKFFGLDKSNGTDYTCEMTARKKADGTLEVIEVSYMPPEEGTTCR